MSLAILPSQPMAYSEHSVPTLLRPSPAKRPKLLRLDTLSATSPTVRNPFRNPLEPTPSIAPKSKSSLRTPLTLLTHIVPDDEQATHSTPTSDSAASSATTSSSASSTLVPYKLTFSTVSILLNSPIPRLPQRAPFSQTRPKFPAPKKVAFREPLTEDITTNPLTLRHSEIDSSTLAISTLELTPSDPYEEDQQTSRSMSSNSSGAEGQTAPVSPRTGDKRKPSDDDDGDEDSCPVTPVAGRRKRHRQWVWTLSPVDTMGDVSFSQPQHRQPGGGYMIDREERETDDRRIPLPLL